MTIAIDTIIDKIIAAEGGYVNHPDDTGGPTNHGITQATAIAAGYHGSMTALPIDTARHIYYERYIENPGFSLLIPISEPIAAEVIDAGVLSGPSVPSKWLQRLLNVFNKKSTAYPELVVDGSIGLVTATRLKTYLGQRGTEGEQVLLAALNHLQGAFLIELAERREQNETFIYGWLKRTT